MPGVFVEKSRFGSKLDLGYNINKDFSAYFTNGIASTTYKFIIEDSNKSFTKKDLGYFYGAGLNFEVNKNYVISLEYNIQHTSMNDGLGAKLRSIHRVSKLAFSYNF